MEVKYCGENVPKTRAKKEMSPDQRKDAIKAMLAKAGMNVGVGPISRDHINKVENILITKGVISAKEHPSRRIQITVKSLVKSWSQIHLKMNEDEWNNIDIKEIILTNNSDIVFIYCNSQEDANKFTSKAWNLPKDTGPSTPRIVMFVDRRAMKRHKALINIAKAMREHANNSIQTSIRTGKTDFLLRKRRRGSNVPWSEIPPIVVTQEIPNFEIGRYKDIVNPSNNPDKEEEV